MIANCYRSQQHGTYMQRTSHNHPIEIAEVTAQRGQGRIGITFCPGKVDPAAATGAWHRDLGLDLDAIADWGASAVITLIEDHEIDHLQVRDLGREVERRYMQWLHLPIQDVSVPGPTFEAAWEAQGEGIRARLRDGFDVLVHCRGGLGRAGTIAARLLVELGVAPTEAIAQVRGVRPGAIETGEQENHVLIQSALSKGQPETTGDAIRDRAIGALLGLAVGDALGTTLEFQSRDSYEPITGIVGGGPFHLQPGEWTDDTAMALALAESLAACDGLDEADLMGRFDDWFQNGAFSCTGVCFDIGITTSRALQRWRATGNPHSGATDPNTAGNGSLMRLAPATVRYWRDRDTLRDVAARQSRTTHSAAEAVDACVLWAEMLADAIEGAPRAEVLRNRTGTYSGNIAGIAAGSWRGKARDAIRASGYVVHSAEAALWSVGRSCDFPTSVLTAANLGEDADTTAAIAGQLAGALYGASDIPAEFLHPIAWRERIEAVAVALFDAGL